MLIKHQFGIFLSYKTLYAVDRLLRGSVLGDGLGAFRDGVLGQLAREDQANGSLDLAGGQGRFLVDTRQLLVLVLTNGVS